jgi:dipeptidyl aminopeptidase/acylaminoacyl peptidase
MLPTSQNTDPTVASLIGGTLQDKFDLAKQASPLTYVTSKAVPLMMVHGTDDKIVKYEHAVVLDKALKAAGAHPILITLTGGDHGVNGGSELSHRVQQFVDLHLRGIPTEISSEPIPAVK